MCATQSPKPLWGLKKPSGHAVHVPALLPPQRASSVPATHQRWQSEQTPSPFEEKVPAGHGVESSLPSHALPAAQGSQRTSLMLEPLKTLRWRASHEGRRGMQPL
jgi:hypothetical protein